MAVAAHRHGQWFLAHVVVGEQLSSQQLHILPDFLHHFFKSWIGHFGSSMAKGQQLLLQVIDLMGSRLSLQVLVRPHFPLPHIQLFLPSSGLDDLLGFQAHHWMQRQQPSFNSFTSLQLGKIWSLEKIPYSISLIAPLLGRSSHTLHRIIPQRVFQYLLLSRCSFRKYSCLP